MTNILAQCPRCKAKYKVVAEQVAGKKLRCASCRKPFRVPATAAAAAQARRAPAKKPQQVEVVDDFAEEVDDVVEEFVDDIEVVDDADVEVVDDAGDIDFPVDEPVDEFEDLAAEDFSRPARPLPAASLARKKKKKTSDDVAGDDNDESAAKKKVIAIVGVVSVVGIALIAGLFMLGRGMMNKVQLARQVQAPAEFEEFTLPDLPFKCEFPKNWDAKGGGGTGGKPGWARSESGSALISIRDSLAGSAVGDISGASNPSDGGPPDLAPVARVHDFQLTRIAEDFTDYREQAPDVIDTEFGDARRSEFTAKGTWGRSIRGYRATLLNSVRQVNVICQCPEGDFEALRPAFERVINSVAPH